MDISPSAAPTVVIVGRPNVGKSTLFNRITGKRRSIVGDQPGITRDRIYGTADWHGKVFEVVDTGGMVPGDIAEIPARILEQAQVAIETASQIVLVVDGRSELTSTDQELARLLRQTGKPMLLAVNKVDTAALMAQAHMFHSLGIPRLVPISAEHGLGIDDLLDEATAAFAVPAVEAEKKDEINVAIIGRPNVGKSTLLNQLAGSERSIVSEVPGTTRDAVDTIVEHEGVAHRLVDTAGIRRKGRTDQMAEKLSVVMARRHIRLSDVALLVVDGTAGITALDATIAGYAYQSGKSVVIVVNKWDQVEQRREAATRLNDQMDMKFKFLDYAPRIFISAKTGHSVEKLFPLIKEIAAARHRHIPTGELNRFLGSIDLERATTPSGRRPKIYYLTQSSSAPPCFVFFTDQKRQLHFSSNGF